MQWQFRWVCCMSMLHVLAACPCCMSMLHVNAACPCCMPLLHVHDACPCCMSMLHVYAACPCCMSMLHIHDACQYCMSMLHIHAACPWCMSKKRWALQSTCRTSLIRTAHSRFFRQYWPGMDFAEYKMSAQQSYKTWPSAATLEQYSCLIRHLTNLSSCWTIPLITSKAR